jgi:alcohol dehydrogenase class IV
MIPLLPLPRLVFGAGVLSSVASEISLLSICRPLLLSDRGLERAGAVALALGLMPKGTAQYLDVPENPTTAGADAAFAAYQASGCDGIVALGGGSVLDTAKFVAALAGSDVKLAANLLGRPDFIGRHTAPLIAIPTTVGTGSESSPVAALHLGPHDPPIGTRSPFLVPHVAICDPELTRTLPPRLVAATGIDALAHCLEGFFAEPANAIVDALALDGLARAFHEIPRAVQDDGIDARAGLMLAAFAGGAAIHKGLGPAHAIALAFGDQDMHHGMLVAAALPLTVTIVAPHTPQKAARVAAAMNLKGIDQIGPALDELVRGLGLPVNLREAGCKTKSIGKLVESMTQSHFNRTSPYAPTTDEYAKIAAQLLA